MYKVIVIDDEMLVRRGIVMETALPMPSKSLAKKGSISL